MPRYDATLVAALPPFDVLLPARGYGVALPPPFDALGAEMVLPEPDGRVPIVANFVAGLDGTIRVSTDEPASSLVALGNPHDWILLCLLRAVSSVLVVGAGSPRSYDKRQDAESGLPLLAGPLRALRDRLGLGPLHHVVVSASGNVPAEHPMWVGGATLVTTAEGANGLEISPEVEVVVDEAGGRSVTGELVAEVARARTPLRTPGGSPGIVYFEGGPHLFSELLAAGEIDELWLTTSPFVAGPALGQLRITEEPGYARFELAGLSRVGSHLFGRWHTRAAGRSPAALRF